MTPCKAFKQIIPSTQFFRNGDTRKAKDIVQQGGEIPDHKLPGRFIMNLPEEIRDALRSLTSEDTKLAFQDDIALCDERTCTVCGFPYYHCQGIHELTAKGYQCKPIKQRM